MLQVRRKHPLKTAGMTDYVCARRAARAHILSRHPGGREGDGLLGADSVIWNMVRQVKLGRGLPFDRQNQC
jgi:hypothetical protein